MTIEAFMRNEGGADGARLTYQDKWLAFSGSGDTWIVFHRKPGGYKTRVLFAGDLDTALEVLTLGLPRANTARMVSQALNVPIEHADVTVTALQAAFEIRGKQFSWNKTAKIAVEAAGHPDAADPDVRYAAAWLDQVGAK